jgi:hypothetical protein
MKNWLFCGDADTGQLSAIIDLIIDKFAAAMASTPY